jgi:hypothetical protein
MDECLAIKKCVFGLDLALSKNSLAFSRSFATKKRLLSGTVAWKSFPRAVSAIIRVMLGDERAIAMQIFAGDVVPKKKPDPAIY